MTREVKEKWLAALRSGEYVQGHRYLGSKYDGVPKYCCLGVLCEVMGVHGTISPPKPYALNEPDLVLEFGDEGMQIYLPSELKPLLSGVKFEEFAYDDFEHSLSMLNDVYKLDFSSIAAFIDANVGVEDPDGQ